MPLSVLRLEPNPCEAVDPFWSAIFGNELGPFPHPAHVMEPASDGPGRDVYPVFDLELRGQGGATPAGTTAAIGPWWRFEQGAQRASHPRQEDRRPHRRPQGTVGIDCPAERARTIEAYGAVHTGA